MKFSNYLKLRESKEPSFVTSKIKLQKELGSKEFTPFTVNKNSHSNLRSIIKAFLNSNQVGLGYTTIDKTKGEIEPQLKKKNLYLTGGAVRDHLKNKTPKNYDLVTDATISEIRMILDQSEEGFTEVKPINNKFKNDSRYKNLPNFSRNKKFYVSRWDKSGKELEITVEIKGDKYNISPLTKATKSRLIDPEEAEVASSIEEDSRNRDFTINSLYIPLNTADGDNSDLIDPYGGATHLKNNKIKFVGDEAEKRLQEDPMTALRFLNINSRYGDKEIPEEYKELIKKHLKDANVPKDLAKKEFISGIENPDVDPRFYILSAKDLDLLSLIFPNIELSVDDLPANFLGDRWLSTAWMLKNNDTDLLKSSLSNNGWSDTETNDICYLIDFYKWANNNFDPNGFYDLKSRNRGISNSKFKDWAKLLNVNNSNFDKFINYDDSEFRPYIIDGGKKIINPEFSKILGRNPVGNEFENIKRNLLNNNWKNIIQK